MVKDQTLKRLELYFSLLIVKNGPRDPDSFVRIFGFFVGFQFSSTVWSVTFSESDINL